jgi:hypothetical protein
MRRTFTTLLVGGVLLTAGACGTAPESATSATGTSAAPASSAAGAPTAIKSTCEALGQAYGRNMAALAESLTNYVADPPANLKRAQASLAAFATAVDNATKASTDAQLEADGRQTATRMKAKSADPKFFGGIRNTKDIEKTMGPTLTSWLAPVSRHCS